MKAQDIEPFFATLKAANPMPASELEYSTSSSCWPPCSCPPRPPDAGVNKATRRLFHVANTPQAILALGQDQLEDYLKTIGLYRTKAKNLLETCRILIEKHGGQVPRDREALEALPAWAARPQRGAQRGLRRGSDGGGHPHLPRQQPHRPGAGQGPLEVERKLMQRVPKAYLQDAHHWLILHGRYVCVARLPRCWECAVARWCDYQPKTPPPALRA
jgi:endonuclease-3